MSTIFVNKIVESTFNSADDLKALFYTHAYSGIILGVIHGDRRATVEQKRMIKGVCGWRISYGKDLGRAYILESKATGPNHFKQSLLCSYNYYVELL
jgi:hypothetical protein